MDRARQVLAQGLPAGVPRNFSALARYGNVPRTTVRERAKGRPSIEEKAQSQQYLYPPEEKALAEWFCQMSDLGTHVRIKYAGSLAHVIRRNRSTTDEEVKPLGKNWHRAFKERHPEIDKRRLKAMDINHHEVNIYNKVIYWFDVIEEKL